jgi:hypothetical protein
VCERESGGENIIKASHKGHLPCQSIKWCLTSCLICVCCVLCSYSPYLLVPLLLIAVAFLYHPLCQPKTPPAHNKAA